jgi:hypothetical protein
MRVRDIYSQSFITKSLPPGEPQNPAPAPSTQHKVDPVAEARRIVEAWERATGLRLSVEVVAAHLATIRRWQARLPSQKCDRGAPDLS